MNPEDPTPPQEPSQTPEPAPRGRGPVSTPVVVGLIAGSILATAFVVAIVRRSEPSRQPTLDGSGPRGAAAQVPGGPIIQISPAGNIPRGDLRLEWESSEDFESYEAVLIDTRIRPLWRSKPGPETSVEVSKKALEQLQPGASYFWYVIGTRADGSTEQTSSRYFRISE